LSCENSRKLYFLCERVGFMCFFSRFFILKKNEISLKVGIVVPVFISEFYGIEISNIFSMIRREFMTQIKWLLLALSISLALVGFFDGALLQSSIVFNAQHTFLGLNLFLEILIFFIFSIFVVFGIKGFFEAFSQKTANVIVFISGVLLAFVICILCYQILFQE
jgi:hypothetical protein